MRATFALVLAVAASAETFTIRNVSVVDPAAGAVLPNRTIVIEDGRIRSVGEGRARGRGRIIDGKGKFAIPGLVDAHVHLMHQTDFAHMTPEELLPMYVAYGVTSVRDIGDEIVAQKMTQKYAEAHPETSPRVFLASPLIDGDPPHHADIGKPLTDPAKVPEFLSDLKAWGVTTLKLYVKTERTIGRLVIEEGHRQGFVVAGHLGRYSAQDAVPDGIDVLEHIWSVFNYSFPPGNDTRPAVERRATLDLSNPVAVELRRALVRHKTMVDPTLAVFRNMILRNDEAAIRDHPDNAGVPRPLKEHWRRYYQKANLQPETRALRQAEFRKYQELTGLLHKEGVTLLAGTDTPEPFVPPGGALHQELEMLVESGLTPAAALAAATVNNARALRQEKELGRIAPGMLADLVLLNANPLEDIRRTRDIHLVMRGGRIAKAPGTR